MKDKIFVIRKEIMELRKANEKCNQLYKKIEQYPRFWIGVSIVLLVVFLFLLPIYQVSRYGINNTTENATLENEYRATLAQILGGVAIGVGLYYTWRRINIAEEDLKATKEGQITERFTRAVDQLGNPAIEIRLGGIYALERIANESEKDYWPIMEILTAYVRKNSSAETSAETVENKKVTHLVMDMQAYDSATSKLSEVRKVSLDIQAILTVIRRRKNFFNEGEENFLNLRATNLRKADLGDANLQRADLRGAHLEEAYLRDANLQGADLRGAHLQGANLGDAYLQGANLGSAHLQRANFRGALLKKADLEGAHLEYAENLNIDQLYKVKTLYNAKLDEDLLKQLKEKCPALFKKLE
jgi:ribosomal protein L29